jgi:hypothetical protein
MAAENLFNSEIINQIKSSSQVKIIQPVQVGQSNHQNELVFFIKPELLDVEKDEKILNSFHLIEQKFAEYNVEIKGAAIVPGNTLEKFGIMNRHYGFINQLSREASKMIDSETKERIFDLLNLDVNNQREILGGHEFLKTFRTDIKTLSEVWFGKGAQKLRSGFYCIDTTFDNTTIILVNGFHPSQLAHFTREDHSIYLMLLHTDTNWEAMKFDLVGDTFPERALPGSIRGMLYADPQRYGQTEVGINTNGVHLSAGPFEAAFEITNFFGPLINLDPTATPPLVIKQAFVTGFPLKDAIGLLDNPPINGSDLFSKTENLNSIEAVEFAHQWLNKD